MTTAATYKRPPAGRKYYDAAQAQDQARREADRARAAEDEKIKNAEIAKTKQALEELDIDIVEQYDLLEQYYAKKEELKK